MRIPGRLLLAAIAAVATASAVPGDASAQSASGDEAAVEEVVRGLFDAMRASDSAAADRLFHPDARLSGPVEKEGRVMLRTASVDGFLDAMGGAEAEWDERIRNLEVRVDADLATAWMDYTFYHGGELSHCGVNAVQLFRSPEGWKIFQIADTRREEGCPEMEGG